MGPNHGISRKTRPIELIQNMDRIIRTADDHVAEDQLNSPTGKIEIDRRMKITLTEMELGEKLRNFSRSPSGQGPEFSQCNQLLRLQPIPAKNSPFRRSVCNPTTSSSSYEQNFPQCNNQPSMKVVRFTTTADCIKQLSHTQKECDVEIELLLNAGVSCSKIKY